MKPVPERHRFDTEPFEKDFLHRYPVVYRNAIATWPAATWSFESLCQRCGDAKVKVRRYEHGVDGSFIQQCIDHTETISFEKHVRRCLSSSDDARWSLRESWEIFRECPALIDDLRFNQLAPNEELEFEYFFWCGPKDYVTGIHADLMDLNLLAHVLGEKEFYFYAPDQEESLYIDENDSIDGGLYSPVDPFHPDLNRFPKFAGASPILTTLTPHDLLYVPRGWWHAAKALSPSLSVTGAIDRLYGT